MSQLRNISIPYLLNALIGIVFCISAILKLISIDTFELYIYSFEFFSLNLSGLAARCIISTELILGTGLLLNFYPKFFRTCSFLLLSVLSVFLIFTYFTRGNNDNCHCFGEIIELNPIPSIIKNCIFILVLCVGSKVKAFNIRYKKLITILTILISTLSVFIIAPPYNWLQSQKITEYNEAAFEELVSSEMISNEDAETRIICFFGVGCKYCELAAQKLYLIQQNNPSVKMNFVGVFWGDEIKLATFKQETELSYSQEYLIDPVQFLKITNGKMPLVLVLKNGKVIKSLDYKKIQENTLLQLLSENEPS